MSEATHTHNEPNPTDLLQILINAKAAEDQAKANRIAAEKALLPFLESVPEGSKTTDIDGFKVTVTSRVNRRASGDQLAGLQREIRGNLCPVKMVPKLDEPGLKWLQNNEPDIYATAAQFFTATPGKPTVTIKAPLQGAA